jgi:hypothetical protein
MKALFKFAPGDGHVDIRDVGEPICRDDQTAAVRAGQGFVTGS